MYQTSTKIKIVLIDNCADKTSSVSYKMEDYEIYGKQIARTESFSEAKPTWWQLAQVYSGPKKSV